MKRLSIIVPLYNSEQYLPKCIDSLVHQDIPLVEYEIILVNDGSPDHSEDLARQYAKDYSNIVVLSQENKGTSGARNTGLRYATGKYVYFVDPDDYILENSLKEILQRMDDEDLDVLRFGYVEVDENHTPTRSCKHPEQPDYSSNVMDGFTFMGERLGVACYVWTYLFKLSLIKDNGFYFIEGDYFDDTPWLPKVLSFAKRVDSVDVKRHYYLIRSNSLVQSLSPEMIRRKIDGHRFLIQELHNQMNAVGDVNGVKWYRMMISHSVLSLLTMVGLYEYEDRRKYCNELFRDSLVLPLSLYNYSGLNRVKLSVINLSPALYCWVMHIIKKI